MNITMYGIPNCNTIKKAKDWLTSHNIDFTFHNYKKEGIDEATLEAWCKQADWQVLLNQRGTTWRKLSAEDKANVNTEKAVRLMSTYPSMIKRPVVRNLNNDAAIFVGFDEESYAEFFLAKSKTEAE
ncbi:MAG: ArsC family reductase [Ghiorsea sp.]